MSKTYAVDVPNSHDPEDSWVNVDYFDTRDAAIAWVRETFGADEQGRIQLVSEVDDGEPEPSPEENARAQERLEIIDWLDEQCQWDKSGWACGDEARVYRRVRQFVMDRQQKYEEEYC